MLLISAAAAQAQPCPAEADGFLRAVLRGALVADLDWHGEDLVCDGMERPRDAGARLRFRGQLDTGVALNIVIGIDGLEGGVIGVDLPANLTLVVEDHGLFFSSRQQSGCWADIASNTRISGIDGGYRVAGEIFCVRGLAAIGSEASVTLVNLTFAGLLAPPASAAGATADAY